MPAKGHRSFGNAGTTQVDEQAEDLDSSKVGHQSVSYRPLLIG